MNEKRLTIAIIRDTEIVPSIGVKIKHSFVSTKQYPSVFYIQIKDFMSSDLSIFRSLDDIKLPL